MDGKMLARIGAITFVAVALTVTTIELTRKDDAPASAPMPQLRPATDPLRDAQRMSFAVTYSAARWVASLNGAAPFAHGGNVIARAPRIDPAPHIGRRRRRQQGGGKQGRNDGMTRQHGRNPQACVVL